MADTDSQHTLLPKVGELSHYHVLEWLNFAATDLHKGFSPFFNSTISDDIKENIFKPSLKRTLKFLAQHLEKQPHYLNGAQLCIADCYVFVILSWAAHIAIDLVEWPSIQKYMAKLAQRNAFQEALKEEGITLTTIDCGDACGIK